VNIESFREFCIRKPGVTEEFPFDSETLVFKVGGKMFALTDVDEFGTINLKCEPENVTRYIDAYPAVQPGYHMNKKHWITVVNDGTIPDKILFNWIDRSYHLVFESLSVKKRSAIPGKPASKSGK
jgi:predicted DNA-binding protein (MmcQ/YjbR family)